MNPPPHRANGLRLARAVLGGFLFCESAASTAANDLSPPVIVTQPRSQILGVGSTGVFSARIEGSEPLAYQWSRNGANLSDDGVRISGSTEPVLTVSGVQPSDQYLYTLTVTNPAGKAVSLPASLWVLEPPFIISHPAEQAVLPGATVTFRVQATGIDPLRYQWRRNGGALLGPNGATLTLSNVNGLVAGRYDVVVSDAVGTTTTRAARLRVLTPPAISLQPADTTVSTGTPAVAFDVVATGALPLRYQWRLNGAHIPGANSSSYAIAPVELADGGSYSVVVANEAGAVLSSPALLLFDDVPGEPLARDHLNEDALPISSAEGVLQGSNAFATREPAEPFHAGKPGSHSVWFTWNAPNSGIATFSTAGSAFDTLLAVYSGATFASLTHLASDDDRGGFLTSRVQFNAVAGATYQIAIDGLAGQSGPFVLSWSLELTPETVPVILSHPASHTVHEGDDVTLSVLAIDVSPLSFQWLRNGAPLAGAASASLVLPGVQPENVGDYTVEVANAFGWITESRPGSLQLGLETTAQARGKWECLLPLGGGGGSGGGLRAAAATAPEAPPVIVRAGVPDRRTFDGSSTSGGGILHCLGSPQAKEWIWIQTMDGGDVLLDTVGSQVPTLLAVYPQFPFATVPATPSLTCAATNLGDGLATAVSFPAAAHANYWVMVDRLNGMSGVVQLNWLLGHRPRSANPTNVQFRTAPPGTPVHLDARITNAPSPATSFQWYREGRLLIGQTNPVLVLPAVTNRDSGHYSVRATNQLGVAENVWCLRVGTEVALDIGVTNAAGTPLMHVSAGTPREFVLQAAPDLHPPIVWTNLTTKTGPDCFDYFWPVRYTNAPWRGIFRAFTTNAVGP